MRTAFFLLGLLSATYLPAQQPSLTGPVEAITFDAPTRSVRAVIGFPGAASFGPALLDSLDFGSVAPRQNYGIFFQAAKCFFVSGLNSSKTSRVAIAGVTGYPDGIVWAAEGSLVVLYSSAGHWFQTIAGFPGSPVAGPVVDVSSLAGAFTGVGVDAAGKQIALAVSGEDGAVYEATTSGPPFTRLASLAQPVSLSFSADGETLYALDAATVQVIAASVGGQGFQNFALPGITNPVAIQFVEDSQNRQLLYIAAGTDRIVRVFELATQQIVTDVPLNFQPTSLDAFGNGSFVLAPRSRSANPLWLLSNTPQLGAYFVPAVQLQRSDHMTAVIAGRTR